MELTFRIIDICCYMIGTIFVLVYIDLLFIGGKEGRRNRKLRKYLRVENAALAYKMSEEKKKKILQEAIRFANKMIKEAYREYDETQEIQTVPFVMPKGYVKDKQELYEIFLEALYKNENRRLDWDCDIALNPKRDCYFALIKIGRKNTPEEKLKFRREIENAE